MVGIFNLGDPLIKHPFFPLILLALIVTAPRTIAQDEPPPPLEYPPTSWKEFSSPEWQFAVLLPGTPEEKVYSQTVPGESVEMHFFFLKKFASYAILCGDLPADLPLKNVSEFLSGVRDHQFGDLGVITEEQEPALRNAQGAKSFSIQLPQGVVSHVRLYVVGRRLYELEFTSKVIDAPEAILKFNRDKSSNSESTLNGSALKLVTPVYPPLARTAHATGKVEVNVIVDEEGKVIAAQAISGHPLLQAAAVQAARASVFGATMLNGKPIKVIGIINYVFG